MPNRLSRRPYPLLISSRLTNARSRIASWALPYWITAFWLTGAGGRRLHRFPRVAGTGERHSGDEAQHPCASSHRCSGHEFWRPIDMSPLRGAFTMMVFVFLTHGGAYQVFTEVSFQPTCPRTARYALLVLFLSVTV